MFSYKKVVELEQEIERLRRDIFQRDNEIRKVEMLRDLQVEKAVNEIRKEMQKALIESDIRRAAAEASLKTYKEMDTKEERKQLSQMLEKAINGLSQQKVQIVK